MGEWKLIEGKIVDSNPWVKVRKDRCVTDSGLEIPDYFWLQERDGSVVFAATETGEVIMIEQYRYVTGQTILELPGGILDEGENPIKCAERELKEETGFEAEDFHVVFWGYQDQGRSNKKNIVCFARKARLTGSQSLDQNEDIKFKLVKFDELEKMIRENKVNTLTAATAILLALQNRDWFLERK